VIIFLRKSADTRVVISRAEIQRAADFIVVFAAVAERICVEVVDILLFAKGVVGVFCI